MRKKIAPTELAKTTARRLAPPSSGKSRLPRPRRPLSRPKMMMMIAPPYSSRNHHHLSRKIPLSSRNSSFCSKNFFVGCPRQTAPRKMRLCSTATSPHSAPPLLRDACVYICKACAARMKVFRTRECVALTPEREEKKFERIWWSFLKPSFV